MNNLRLLISDLTGLSVVVLFRSFIEYFAGVFFHFTSTVKSHIIAILQRYILSFMLIVAVVSAANAGASSLYAGAASCDITPGMPSFLHGQHQPRVAKEVQYPLTANILALESRKGDRSLESAIIISMDLCVVRESFLMPLREAIQQQLPGG